MSDVSVVSLPKHIKALSSNEPETPRIETLLELEPLKHLLSTTREYHDNNFLSSFLRLVGSIMAFHYTSIAVNQDECPLIKRSSPNFSHNTTTRATSSCHCIVRKVGWASLTMLGGALTCLSVQWGHDMPFCSVGLWHAFEALTSLFAGRGFFWSDLSLTAFDWSLCVVTVAASEI